MTRPGWRHREVGSHQTMDDSEGIASAGGLDVEYGIGSRMTLRCLAGVIERRAWGQM